MAEVNHDAQPIHLADDLSAKVTHAIVCMTATCGVADIVITIMAKRHIDDAALGKVVEVLNLAVQGVSVLNAQHDALLAKVLVLPQIIGGACQSNVLTAFLDNIFYLVENIVGIRCRMISWLGQVCHHNGGVLMPFCHLMEVDENLGVTVHEVNLLWKALDLVALYL